jgi:D-tyrosyl-tRNA(Tyr) deacylase
MRAVVQRVQEASVRVEDKTVGSIEKGVLVYLGVGEDDTEKDLDYLVGKVAGLRIFPDENDHMNRSVVDAGGSALVISQFTLFGDARRGKRPSFITAMAPDKANTVYETFCAKLEESGVPCAKGEFGAMMKVVSINDGPVTILLDSKKVF